MDGIVTPAQKSAKVWKYFGYKREENGKKVTCKLCGVKVVHGGGTTNLNIHLRNWHRSSYDELHTENSPSTSKGSSTQKTLNNYVVHHAHATKLPHHSEKAKRLTNLIVK